MWCVHHTKLTCPHPRLGLNQKPNLINKSRRLGISQVFKREVPRGWKNKVKLVECIFASLYRNDTKWNKLKSCVCSGGACLWKGWFTFQRASEIFRGWRIVRHEATAWVVTRPQAAYTYMYNLCAVQSCLSLWSPPLRGWRRVISKKAPLIDALGSSFAYYVNDTKINPLPLDSLPLLSLEGRLVSSHWYGP